ncbi:hypothetical protein IQ07DRAFT_638608 [Pyrenochaeta sp. DS3sAY3a]|nr:hypothetical protein IQ07DRAFT_638608 [Pyrenochaeta sp. DS3sAY3a]
MLPIRSFSTYLFLLLIADLTSGKTLVPLRPGGGSKHSRRHVPADLDLLSAETFLWGDEDGAEVARLTVDMPRETENILSMEHFDGMLTDVTCSEETISMTFEEDASFAYAQATWDWVNGADNHSFVMVAGPGDCGSNANRIPFVVSCIQYNETTNTALLSVNQSDWKSIAHSFDLVVGSTGQGSNTDLRARDITKNTAIDFNHDFPFSLALSKGPLDAKLACTNCSTTGQFAIEFRVSQKFLVPTGASMKIVPQGISAVGQVKLSGSGELAEPITKTFDVLSIPLSALNIPGILEFGPFLAVAVGASLSPLSLSGGISAGATASFSDDAVLSVDLLDPTKNTFQGWTPNVKSLGVTVDASVTTTFGVFLQPSVEIRAEALGNGFEIGLNMKIPNVNAKITALSSSSGACPNAKPKTNLGIKIGTSIGAQVSLQALKSGEADPLFGVQLAEIDTPIGEVCFPFGRKIATREVGHSHAGMY